MYFYLLVRKFYLGLLQRKIINIHRNSEKVFLVKMPGSDTMISLQLTPFNQLVYFLGSNVLFSILFVTVDPQLDSCIMYSVCPSEQVKLFIY